MYISEFKNGINGKRKIKKLIIPIDIVWKDVYTSFHNKPTT